MTRGWRTPHSDQRPHSVVKVVLKACMAALALMLAAAQPARAEYLLQAGDTLDFAMLGMTDMRQKSTIGPDGSVYLPIVGQVPAAGQPLNQLKNKVRSLLANKVYRQIAPDGKEVMIVVSGDELTLDVFAYRPVYVNGDVLKPGEQPFRPGMTVRQAVSVAGGYDALKMRLGNPLTDPIDFKGDYVANLTELVREQARNIRLQAELQDAGEPKFDSIKASGIAPANLDRILKTEAQQFRVRRADYENEQRFLREAIVQAEKRVALLNEQKDREAQGQTEDQNELDRVRDLVQRGSAPVTRIVDARRTLLFSATRVLQTVSQVTQMERDREDLQRKLVKANDDYRKEVLKDISDSNVKMGTFKAKVDALRDKMGVAAGPRLIQTEAAKPKLLVFRKIGENVERIVGDLDLELSPGDVVEVTVPVADLGEPTALATPAN